MLIISNNSVTLVFNGTTYHNQVTEEQLQEIYNQHPDYNYDVIKDMLCPPTKEKEKNQKVMDIFTVFEDHEDFTVVNGSIYRKGINLSMPIKVIEDYKYRIEDRRSYTDLDNFWKLCALNPNAQSRDRLLHHVHKYGLTITEGGYIVTYRNVNVYKKGNQELSTAVSQFFLKTKIQKKSPKNYEVYENDNSYYLNNTKTSSIPKGNKVGNLRELYEQGFDTVYTDKYSGDFRIKLGEVVSMPREHCDESDNMCSSGLHTAGAKWLNDQGVGYFGGTGVVCLVNPMDVVAAPMKDNYGKLRSCSYLPIAIADRDIDGKIIPIDTNGFELTYENYIIDSINEKLESMELEEYQITTLDFKLTPDMSIFHNLENYLEIINTRNVNIYADKECYWEEE